MHLCSPSQNSVPLHLARHVLVSTDGVVFFQVGEVTFEDRGDPPPPPPAVPCGSPFGSGSAVRCIPWKCLSVGGGQTRTAAPQRPRNRDG